MEPTLKMELEIQEKLKSNDASATAKFEKYLEYLRNQGVGKGLNIGDEAPNFTLEDASGQWITLFEELKKGPIIVTFYRGEWCPFCNLQLKAYERIMTDIKKSGAQLIAISPQMPDNSLSQEKSRS